MLGRKEVWYFGAALLFGASGFVLAFVRTEALLGYAAVLSPICAGLYGGAAMKVYSEKRKPKPEKDQPEPL